jgi:hypothetical protein
MTFRTKLSLRIRARLFPSTISSQCIVNFCVGLGLAGIEAVGLGDLKHIVENSAQAKAPY